MRKIRLAPLLLPMMGLLALGLVGCTADPIDSETTPTPEPTATSTAPPVSEVSAPQPRIALDCASALPLDGLRDLLGLRAQPLSVVSEAATASPDSTTLRQLGALECRWGNGIEPHPFGYLEDDGQIVRLTVLPEGRDAALRYLEVYRDGSGTEPMPYGTEMLPPRCGGTDLPWPSGSCEVEGWVGASWVVLRVDGIVLEPDESGTDLLERFRVLADPLIATLSGAAVTAPRWSPETTSADPSPTCDELATSAQLGELTTIVDPWFAEYRDGPQVGLYLYGREHARSAHCSIGFPASDGGVGYVDVLPGGAWAFDEYAAEWARQGAIAAEIAPLPAGSAMLRCGDPADYCRLDASVNGDWMQVALAPVPGDAAYVDSPDQLSAYQASRDAITRIGGLIVGNMLAAAS